MDAIVEESWKFFEKLSKNVDGSNRDVRYPSHSITSSVLD